MYEPPAGDKRSKKECIDTGRYPLREKWCLCCRSGRSEHDGWGRGWCKQQVFPQRGRSKRQGQSAASAGRTHLGELQEYPTYLSLLVVGNPCDPHACLTKRKQQQAQVCDDHAKRRE